MSFSWTPEEDELLISMVEEREFLYNSSHVDYKKQYKRRAAWEEIGMIINKPVSNCLKRWTNIKDHYVRTKKKGSIGSSLSKQNRMERLAFLEGTRFDVNSSTTSTPFSPDEESVSIEPFNFEDPLQSTFYQDTTCLETPSKKRAIAKTLTSSFTVDVNESAKERRHAEKMKLLKQFVSIPAVEPSNHHVDLFFQLMAQTVKKFPETKMIEAKNKVWAVISEMELQVYTQNTNPRKEHTNASAR